MNKQRIATLILTLAATAAHAEAFSGSGTSPYDRAAACQSAKDNAKLQAIADRKEVAGYSDCDCSQDKVIKAWSCTVDAYARDKR